MVSAKESIKGTMITNIETDDGKGMTICSSKVESEYLSPRQLVQSALAGCLSMSIRRELTNDEIAYEDVIVDVDMDEELNFGYSIRIISGDDPEKIARCKERAVADCFIKGLLSKKRNITETQHLETTQTFEACCG